MPTILTEVDTFSADITVPEGGDDRTSASVNAPIQKLTNRSRNLKNRVDALATEVVSAKFRYGTPLTVQRTQNSLLATPHNDSGWTNGAVRFSAGNAEILRISLHDLVDESTLTAVFVPHSTTEVGRTGSNRAYMQVSKLAYNSTSAVSIGAQTFELGGGGSVPLVVSGLSEVIDLGTYQYFVTLVAGTPHGDSVNGPTLALMTVTENQP
jgi:hypothetical protein